jgi:uncharacterized membrane protein
MSAPSAKAERLLDRALAAGLLATLLAGLLAAPLAPLLSASGSQLGSALHELFSPLCHQDPARSPALFGVALPLCWRCLGVLLGATALALFHRRLRPLIAPRDWLLLLCLGALDWALKLHGWVPDWGAERLLSGLLLGLGLGLLCQRVRGRMGAWIARSETAQASETRSRLRGLFRPLPVHSEKRAACATVTRSAAAMSASR